jgi:hypothetical protein
MQVTSENLLTATRGHDTLLIRYDGTTEVVRLAIDENDNGNVVQVAGNRESLNKLCTALAQKAPAAGETRIVTLIEEETARAELCADYEGYEIRLHQIGERPRTFRCLLDDGATLGKAIRGTFGFWG